MKFWIDVKNSHEPLFFKSISKLLTDSEIFYTTRDYAEIIKLMENYKFDFLNVGGRVEGNLIARVAGFYFRALLLMIKVPFFDVSISHLSGHAIIASRFRNRPHIAFTDNDVNHFHNKRIMPLISKLIVPKCIPAKNFTMDGLKKERLFRYNGYKEDIYISDYKPDTNFMNSMPFKKFITLRPEALQAVYVHKNSQSIVPLLLKKCEERKINVLLLPRYDSDYEYRKNFTNVFIPDRPLNGLDVCYFSKAVLTGAGTFAREAACIGTPAVSFYPGKNLLSVDKQMVKDGLVLHSRNPNEILDYVSSKKSKDLNLSRSQKVKEEVKNILQSAMTSK